jgi:beta-N-acetylhexosaminidase
MLGPVVVDLVGHALTSAEIDLIQHPQVGGLILFGRNFASAAQITDLVSSVRAVRAELIIAVDQEGGRVQRLRDGFTRLPSLQKLGHLYQVAPELAEQVIPEIAWLMAAELLAVGIDISFAPVLDTDEHFSSVIGDRSFGSDFDCVSRLGGWYLDGMAAAGMKATAKHFPGHGAVKADSHYALPVDERDFDSVWSTDMQPFRELLSRVAGVMPAHILFNKIDPSPVGCSPFWLQEVLRRRLGFDGVIFSDDLSMAAAEFAGSYSERARAALRAGCDAILICNQPAHAAAVLSSLAGAQWLCDNKMAQMKPSPVRSVMSLNELRDSSRWQEAQQHLQTLESLA